MKKKLLSLLVAATMIGSMAGTTTVFAGEDLEDVSEPVTLSLMVTTRPSTDNKDFYLDLLPELVHEKFPNITIEVEQLPTDQYKQTVRLKFASGEGPDLFTWWAKKQSEDLVNAGYVRDLSDFSELNKFNSDITSAYTFDDKVYGLPLGTSFLTTWYNKDMFKEVGYDNPPTNWDEFVDVCKKLKEAGHTPITCGDNSSYVIQFMLRILILINSFILAKHILQMTAGLILFLNFSTCMIMDMQQMIRWDYPRIRADSSSLMAKQQ